MSDKIRIKFTDRLMKIIEKLSKDDHYVAFELSYLSDPYSKYHNGLNITEVDIGKDYNFKVTIDGKKHNMKVGKFLRYYFSDIFSENEIKRFIRAYNNLKSGKKDTEDFGKRINLGIFEYNPKDPRSTFLSLTTKTYPHGHEKEVLSFLPNLNKDKHGNYYKIIGESSVMFTSHLDTADSYQTPTSLYSRDVQGNEIIFTDGTSILGADDKAGVTIMLYMMAHNIPGVYYFFIGEEVGGIGSNMLSSDFTNTDYLRKIKKCVSFDRRKNNSVITEQLGRTCCSDDFGNALCDEYNKSGLNLSLDPTGIYTDSASFIDDIPECTNVSVGYNNEHTVREYQNMTFLKKICEASLKVDWESLPVKRKAGIDPDIIKKYKKLIKDVKSTSFDSEVKFVGIGDIVYIKVELSYYSVEDVYQTISILKRLLEKYNIRNDYVQVFDSHIKIELKK